MKSCFFLFFLLANQLFAQDINQAFKPSNQPSPTALTNITDSIFVGNIPDNSISMNLDHKVFSNNTYFKNVVFERPLQCHNSIFYKDAVFKGTTFKDFVDFSGAAFFKDITFSQCTFYNIIFMSGIRADSIAVFNFYQASLPDLVDFSHNKRIAKVVDFTDANFDSVKREKTGSDSRIFLNIFDSDIIKLKLDYLHFRLCFYDPNRQDTLGRYLARLRHNYEADPKNSPLVIAKEDSVLYAELTSSNSFENYISTVFPSTEITASVVQNFTHFYITNNWFPARLTRDQTEALYSRLVKNFDDHGQAMSYESADVDRRNFIGGVWNAPRYWNQYGYRKEWIFLWTIGLLLLFCGITCILADRLFITPNGEEPVYEIKKMPDHKALCTSPFLQRLKCSFIYTSAIFFSFSLKIENLNFKRPIFYYVILINVIGLLCLGYLANFILEK